MNMHRNDQHRRNAKAVRPSVLAVAVVAGLFAQGQVWAQDVATPGTDKAKPSDLGTVTVTATGRKEDILAVPYNISAISGDTIEQAHILNSSELLRRATGIGVVDRGDRNASIVSGIRIRGLNVDGSALGDFAVAAPSTVAVYIDKTPIFANFLLSDIDRVEILRGPQGTLYGSGALGGAVRYILRQPELGRFSGMVSLSGSSTDYSSSIGGSGSLTLNVPISPTLAARFNTTINHFPGMTDYRAIYQLDAQGIPVAPQGEASPAAAYTSKKDADTVEQNYGRASLLWKPNDTWDMTLSYTAQADQFGSRRGTSLGTDLAGVPYKDFEIGSIQLEPASRHVNLTSLETNVDLGFATLTSSSSYYNHEGSVTSENTGFYATNHWLYLFYYNYPRPMAQAVRGYGDSAYTQEFRLTSKAGEKFDYVAGVFYFNQTRNASQDSYLRGFKRWFDAVQPPVYYAGNTAISDQDWLYRYNDKFRETAVYGELTWHATDTLQFTGGFRYFSDSDRSSAHQTTGNTTAIAATSDASNSQSESKALFKGNVSWQFSPNSMLYATISQGYRHGGANGVPTTGYFKENPAWLSYKSDTDTNYELGLKGRANGLTYNIDAFYVDWKDPQVNTSTTNWGFYAVANVPKASTRGVEMELAGGIGKHFNYSLGYTYTDAHLDADATSPGSTVVYAVAGAELPGVAKHQFNANGGYSIPLGRGLLTFSGDVYHQSDSQNALSDPPPPPAVQPKSTRLRYTLKSFTLANLSVTYSLDDWDASFWVKNVTNERGSTGAYPIPYMGNTPLYHAGQHYEGSGTKSLDTLPRTLGVTVTYRF